MPFFLVKNIDGGINALEHTYLLTDTEGATIGQALKLVNGRLTKAAPTDTPEFISMRTQVAEAVSKTILPVRRVVETDEFETTATATVAQTLVGQKVTIAADGGQVTATTAGGVFLISSTNGATKVRGYFRR
jgi:hypothetical protein